MCIRCFFQTSRCRFKTAAFTPYTHAHTLAPTCTPHSAKAGCPWCWARGRVWDSSGPQDLTKQVQVAPPNSPRDGSEGHSAESNMSGVGEKRLLVDADTLAGTGPRCEGSNLILHSWPQPAFLCRPGSPGVLGCSLWSSGPRPSAAAHPPWLCGPEPGADPLCASPWSQWVEDDDGTDFTEWLGDTRCG